jgi:hypothetical protein
MASQAGTRSGVAILRQAVFLEHTLHPDPGSQDQCNDKNDEDYVCHKTIVPTILQKVVCGVVFEVD